MIKKIIFLAVAISLVFPVLTLAEGDLETFEARVEKIIEQKESLSENGQKVVQQDLLLRGTEGQWKGKEIKHKGLGEVDIVNGQPFKEGDLVLVQRTVGPGGEEVFFATDYVRRDWLYILAGLFAAVVVATGGWKGLKSLISLVASFFLLSKIILPLILAGYNPFLVSLFGAFLILAIIIYLTEGLNRKSNLAMASVFFSLLITLGLSSLFVYLTRLGGLADEEAGFLLGLTGSPIDFQGLLLAGFIIGAIGVLDDVVIGQIEAVRQLKEANPHFSRLEVFKAAYKIGNTHLGAIVNTLFLTYAGASLPLLLLFSLQQGAAVSFSSAINNELLATEIVRTLVGSIGVALSMPVATALAARFLKIGRSGG